MSFALEIQVIFNFLDIISDQLSLKMSFAKIQILQAMQSPAMNYRKEITILACQDEVCARIHKILKMDLSSFCIFAERRVGNASNAA